MPGIRKIDHIGITVPDIDEACLFFENILGAKTLFTAAENIMDEGSDWMLDQFNVHPRSIIKELRFVRLPDGSIIEVFEYFSPDQNLNQPKNSDIGGHHLAFYVDDIYEAIDFLRNNDIVVLGEPLSYSDGPNLGLTCCYFLSPWGMQMEIVSAPNGTASDLYA